ncbi:MAG: terpene cyclase/mutase family protein, partial [Phycisphaeraceae bacterium]|nr:terpene cyclase/mutase family protein [Phycisphaeraceae bacterium]
MMKRLVLPCLAIWIGAGSALAQTESDPLLPDPREMSRIEACVDRGLEYLATCQEADGSFRSGKGKNNGINGICLLAFLGRGHLPGRGPFAPVIDRAMSFILSTQTDQGLYKSPSPTHGPMYEHALSTLAMVQAYGGAPTPAMHISVQRAVDLIVKSQSPLGGWRYQPIPADADLSVTVMQIVALRAAINARLAVPQATIDGAMRYVRACVVPSGGFAYQPGGGPGAARTAAGVLSLQLLGAYDDPAVQRGLDYLSKQPISENTAHFWYMAYYAMQAHFQAGGDIWSKWHPSAREFLLKNQNEDGSWPGWKEEEFNGPVKSYSTAFA